MITTNEKCDWIDYLIANGCGVVGGLVDVFLVGVPGESKLQTWTDKQSDKDIHKIIYSLPNENTFEDITFTMKNGKTFSVRPCDAMDDGYTLVWSDDAEY